MEFLVAGVNALCPGGAVYSLHKARPLRAARGGASVSGPRLQLLSGVSCGGC